MGRRKGSKNKRSVGIPASVADALGNEDPWKVLQDVYAMPLKQLQKLVRSKQGQAAIAMKIRAAEIAMPYKYSKMPIAVTTPDLHLPVLEIYKTVNQQQLQQLMKDVTPKVGRTAKSDDTITVEHQEVKVNDSTD